MRSRITTLAGLILAALLLHGASAAEEPTPVPASKLAINAEEVAAGGEQFPEGTGGGDLTPVQDSFREQLRAIFEEEEKALAELRVHIAEAPDQASRLELERRMADLKQQTEIDILRLQLERANAEGRTEDAQRIEAGIQGILEPTPMVPTTEKRVRASH